MQTLRWTGTVILLAVAALMIGATVQARFAVSHLLDTDQYVATVAPLAKDPAVQAAVTNRVSAEIIKAADIPTLTAQVAAELAGALNIKQTQAIARMATPAISQWATEQITKIVNRLVTSDRFAALWTEANRIAHTQIRKVLTGENGSVVSTQGADIVVDLGAVLKAAKDDLVAQGWTILANIPDVSIPLTIAHIDRLPEIQGSIQLLQAQAIWLPFLTIAVSALAVWLAPDRRIALAIGLVLAAAVMLLAVLGYGVGRNWYANRVGQKGLNVSAALVVWDTVLAYADEAQKTALVTALVGAVGLFLAGPNRLGRLFRRGASALLDPFSRAIGPRPRLRAFLATWQGQLGLALGFLGMLLLLVSPEPGSAIAVVALGCLATAIVALLGRFPTPAPA